MAAAKAPAGDPIRSRTADLRYPTGRSFPSSRATAPAPTSGAPRSACSTRRSRRPTAASARSPGTRCWPARRRSTSLQDLAAGRDGRGVQDLPGRHQGPAHDAGRRRHPLAQRGPAPDPRPLRLPAPGALLQRRAEPGQQARAGRRGDLPREHRGHLRRHRVGGGQRRGEEDHRVPPEGHGGQEHPLPGHQRHRHQAGVARGHRTPGARRHLATRCAPVAAA